MPAHSIRARPPRGSVQTVRIEQDPDIVSAFVQDAAHYPGGHAGGVAMPACEADVAAVLKTARGPVLPIGAQSSLTGGATPDGGIVLSSARLNRILEIASDVVRVEAGVTLAALDAALVAAGKHYPPVPTFTGAFVGGIVSTNAAGAATFKYGTTRDWVQALTVVLANGEVLDIARGQTAAAADGTFELVTTE